MLTCGLCWGIKGLTWSCRFYFCGAEGTQRNCESPGQKLSKGKIIHCFFLLNVFLPVRWPYIYIYFFFCSHTMTLNVLWVRLRQKHTSLSAVRWISHKLLGQLAEAYEPRTGHFSLLSSFSGPSHARWVTVIQGRNHLCVPTALLRLRHSSHEVCFANIWLARGVRKELRSCLSKNPLSRCWTHKHLDQGGAECVCLCL